MSIALWTAVIGVAVAFAVAGWLTDRIRVADEEYQRGWRNGHRVATNEIERRLDNFWKKVIAGLEKASREGSAVIHLPEQSNNEKGGAK